MPIVLDLYGCQGGAGKGYMDAGFEVLAVDIDAGALKRHPAVGVHVGSALAVLATLVAGGKVPFTMRDGSVRWIGRDDIALVHASPPCQGYSRATAGNPAARGKHERLIAATRDLLVELGLPWVIENVEEARSQMHDPALLCGRMFGLCADDEDGEPLVLDRHRLFESSFPIAPPAHPAHTGIVQVAGVYGGSRRWTKPQGWTGTLADLAPLDRHEARVVRKGGYVPRSAAVQSRLLGIDWMTQHGRQQSIPPVYAEFVGRQFLEAA